MKFVMLTIAMFLLVSKSNARDCTTQARLDQAIASMKAELEGNLLSKAIQIHSILKQQVPAQAYSQMQQYDRPLRPIEAIQIEAALAQTLYASAHARDGTSRCQREDGNNNGYPLGKIHWVCRGRTLELALHANNGMGVFTLVIQKTVGRELTAPISFRQSVYVKERYNKIETSSRISQVIFPATQNGGGTVVAEHVRAEDLIQVSQALASQNQICD